jgi:peptide/nickel transport system ATP-binding protein
MSTPLLEVEDLQVAYPSPAGAAKEPLRAVDGVSFALARGETLGLVGESGCGKSSLARALVGLERPRSGRVRFDGTELTALAPRRWRPLRRRFQLVFQDPFASLDPRWTVGAIVAEPLAIHERMPRPQRDARVAALLRDVGLDPAAAGQHPHALSGGQRQRIALARALALGPELLILDEPVSSLDVSVQAQVLNLILDLRQAHGLACLLIAHHLAVVRHLADRVAVMFQGRLVEIGPRDAVFEAPSHPYTQALLAAAPVPDPAHVPASPRSMGVEAVAAAGWCTGCAFAPRCPRAVPRCRSETPRLAASPGGGLVACHRPGALREG